MSLTICCLGDVMAGENHYHFGRGIRTRYKNNYNNLIKENVKQVLFNSADVLLYNFEYSLAKLKNIRNEINSSIYRAAEDSLDIFPANLKKVVNIANNHFSQHGKQEAQYTKEILRAKNYTIVGEDNLPAIIADNDKIIKIWGVSLIRDTFYCNEYFLSDYNNLIEDLQLPQKGKDEKWIIAIHWGDEYVTTPSDKQIELGRKLADAGFDLIAGHHPHVVQPVEQYKDSVIIYSMGNFIFDQNFSSITRKGLAVIVKLDEKIKLAAKYTTKQNKYRVTEVFDNKEVLFNGNQVPDYKKRLKRSSLYIRLLMKAELLTHLPEAHPQTISLLLGSAKRKMKTPAAVEKKENPKKEEKIFQDS